MMKIRKYKAGLPLLFAQTLPTVCIGNNKKCVGGNFEIEDDISAPLHNRLVLGQNTNKRSLFSRSIINVSHTHKMILSWRVPRGMQNVPSSWRIVIIPSNNHSSWAFPRRNLLTCMFALNPSFFLPHGMHSTPQ